MKRKAPYTIGFLLTNLVGDYNWGQWSAAHKVATELGINLVLFSPFFFYDHAGIRDEYVHTFQLASGENIDGLLITSGSMGIYWNPQELEELIRSYGNLPIVSIAQEFDGISSVMIDNKKGMYNLVDHFITKHEYSKIAFIRGPSHNQDAEIRYSAYLEALKDNGIDYDKRLIVSGDFSLQAGKAAVQVLLDKREVSFDAILAANDDMILGAFSELKARGMRVPEDVAIGGFDDIDTVKNTDPPISSVKQDSQEQVEVAFRILLDMINKKAVKETTYLPAKLMIRKSCGCNNVEEPVVEKPKSREYEISEKTKAIKETAKGYDVGNLSYFFTSIMNDLKHEPVFDQVEEVLPKLAISSFYLAFYKNGEPLDFRRDVFPPEKVNLVFAYRDNERVDLDTLSREFNPLLLLPDEEFFDKRRSVCISELIFKNDHYGFVVFELNSDINPLVFHLILMQLTSCFQTIYINGELEMAFDKLKKLDRVKTDFFSNISHEFRTPLTLIHSPLEAVIAGGYGAAVPSQHEVFKAMHRNTLRLSRLINNLLDFTKIEAGKMRIKKKKTDIGELLNYYISSIYSGASNLGITIGLVNRGGKVVTWLDRDLFEKAFFNLISNAFKFTPKGGSVSVVLSSTRNAFLISVKDTGIGIKEEDLDRIFERFGQAKHSRGASRKFEGSGIGLAFTKEIVELHNGKIWVESVYGEGSTFFMSIPFQKAPDNANEGEALDDAVEDLAEVKSYLLADFQEDASDELPASVKIPAQMEEGQEEIVKSPHTILVCDDNKDLRNFLFSLLDTYYHVILATNGREGLEAAQKYKPTLILSDVMMPEMSGYELCNYVKQNPELKNIPVILITAKTELHKKIEGFEHGADDFLAKPFNAKELLLRIRVFINREELRKELEEKNRLLSEISRQDSLTGLLNHASVLEEFEREFKEAKERSVPLSIMMVDVDKFKNFNDTYGHQVGDEVILAFAETIKEHVRPEDIKGRYGGDEFTVILPHCGRHSIVSVFQRIYKGIRSIRIPYEGKEISVSASIGVAILESGVACKDPKHLLELADQALYIVKERGRDQGCILIYDPSKELNPEELSAE